MAKQLGATTLDDLTQAKMMQCRASIENSTTIKEASTKIWTYGTIKSIIAFGLKAGLDTDQISSALDRCKVFWTGDEVSAPKPRPISREHFHKLLETGNRNWHKWLLVGLNLCLHMEEVCELKWQDFDLDAGYYACIRKKTRQNKILRAAVLWTEALKESEAIPHENDGHIFISSHGKRYNKNTRVNDFRVLRIKAQLPEEITFETLKDGSYTAAINGKTVEERFARVLAGHRAHGLQDSYVLRNSECTADACQAVYKFYGPFPSKEALCHSE